MKILLVILLLAAAAGIFYYKRSRPVSKAPAPTTEQFAGKPAPAGAAPVHMVNPAKLVPPAQPPPGAIIPGGLPGVATQTPAR